MKMAQTLNNSLNGIKRVDTKPQNGTEQNTVLFSNFFVQKNSI